MLIDDVPAPGQRYDVGGFRLHIDCKGKPNHLPTVIIEGGAGVSTPINYWLQQHLQDRVQVCRYDRAGLGWSDDSVTVRDADTIAGELHTLLAKAEIKPPYILAGHSLGGPLVRVYADHYPSEVAGLIFIDSSHPEQDERLYGSPPSNNTWIYTIARVLGELGLLLYLYDTEEQLEEGLPQHELVALRWMARNGRIGREGGKEGYSLPSVLDRAAQTTDFGSTPIRVFTAGPEVQGDVNGISGEKFTEIWRALQAELSTLSTDGKHFIVEGATHMSIVTTRRYAKVVTEEIHRVLDVMEHRRSLPGKK
ncbi:alpha/beta hydrolase [Exilibacterium tricleocarpae]|uniref:Alpha/beta hydrolase n=1 Tax=Exilibacterium tricleocarpae TaxID=2591008 RepID=A0A545T8E8_9GAMM|nr:alpha/beta fold hydrolase [Exilibacterium tricleocarpae]TQV73502.1 alpha/beta hydrolase [Exilibacterium tricleocarpae]